MFSILYLAYSALAALMPGLLAPQSQIAMDTRTPECTAWVDSVYNSLTERQRIGQLMIAAVDPGKGRETEATIRLYVQKCDMGGLLFSRGTAQEFAQMAAYAQSLSPGLPVLMTLDGEWGPAMRVDDTPRFPYNMGLGAIADRDVLYDYGREVARQCHALGVHVNFAPVLDVNSNPDNPVIGKRSLGEDPRRVAALGTAYARGLEDGGIQAVAKHFPGHGDTDTDSHKALPVVTHSADTLRDVDLLPFRRYIHGGGTGVMVGHLTVPALDASLAPASLSQPITTGLLRDKMHFGGLIYTDALGMQGAKIEGQNNCVVALEAGTDLLLCGKPQRDIEAVERAVASGEISRELIEERCKRVLAYKYALTHRKPVPADASEIAAVLDSPEAQAIRTRLANASATALRNDSQLLPIGDLAGRRIAVVSIGADRDNEFADLCRRYAAVDFVAPGADLSKYDIVIAGVFSDSAVARQQLQTVSRHPGAIAAFMINPYRMARFDAALANLHHVVTVYDDTPETRRAAAQAIFGGIDVSGRLPVNLPGIAELGSGVDLKKTRLGYTSPIAEGMRPDLQATIDSIAAVAIESGAFPGCQVLVARNGNVVIDSQYGRTTKGGKPIDPYTLYDLASVSKTVGTLPGVMKAYDLGLFDIDTPAAAYIPGLNTEGKDTITVRQLLFHQSGFPPGLKMYDLMIDSNSYEGKLIVSKPDKQHKIKIQKNAYGANSGRLRTDIASHTRSEQFPIEAAKDVYVGPHTYDTIMQRIYDIELRQPVRYVYSCLNFCLLMDLEQRVTGAEHYAWVRDSIWAPIGAEGFCYRPTVNHADREVAYTEQDTYLRRQHVHGYVHDELAAFSGGIQGNAGVFGTATDIAKLCQMWLNGGTYGGRRVLSEETCRLFTTEKSPTCRRGLGFDKPDMTDADASPLCEEASAATFGHTGFTGTCFWVDPDNDLIFIFLSNRVDPTRDNRAFTETRARAEMFRQTILSVDHEH